MRLTFILKPKRMAKAIKYFLFPIRPNKEEEVFDTYKIYLGSGIMLRQNINISHWLVNWNYGRRKEME